MEGLPDPKFLHGQSRILVREKAHQDVQPALMFGRFERDGCAMAQDDVLDG